MIKLDYLKHTFLLCLLTFGTQGCKESNLETEALNVSDFNKQFFNFTIGKTNLKIEVAVLPEERARGLMYRESMGLMEGMLFIFENGTKQRFWMKNTRIPLDIGYFSSKGFLLEVHKAKPHDISGVPSRSSDIKFVLELNAGTYRKLDIDIGSKIDMMEIYEILKLRGLNPEDYKILPN